MPPKDEVRLLLLETAAQSTMSPWEGGAGTTPWLAGSRGIVAGLVSIAVLAAATPVALDVNGSYLWMLLGGLALAGFIARIEQSAVRPVAFAMGVWALALRLGALLGCSILAATTGGVVLGPDSARYYDASVDLASRGLHLPLLPVIYYGTYHVGHVYLFAACVRYLHADLFGLQTLNCVLGAAAAPLAFGIARKAAPRAALWIGGIVAVYPSLVAFGALDLLKDP